ANTVVRSEVRSEESDPTSGSVSENSTTNYEINRTVEHIVGDTGGVKSLSVAVFVDGTYEAADDGTRTYQPLSEDKISQLRRIVQTAVGLNVVRGDQIEIVNMQFNEQVEPVTSGIPEWVGPATEYGGKAVLFIVLAVIVLSLRKNVANLLASKPSEVSGTQAGSKASPSTGSDHFEGIPDMDDQVIADIQDFASENPEKVAEVIQSWIREVELSGQSQEKVGV
ncbi:MAG: flagellar M-ring protein FliF, partial [Candidatus Krumholzibacteriia bacterium]